jgi:gamma-tubulin complex component 5
MGGTWLEPKVQKITESQAIREILFMLSGLPTNLFQQTEKNRICVAKDFGLEHTSNSVFRGYLDEFCQNGNDIMTLREWSRGTQSIPLLQGLQEATQIRICSLDLKISEVQRSLVAPVSDTIISIIKIREELNAFLGPILKLSHMIAKLQVEPYSHAFRCLELLYDETCTSHMAGDQGSYTFMGKLFFDTFQIYLRPIRTWMETGELVQGDRVFFVCRFSLLLSL